VGWCTEFGVAITACDHPMLAGAHACTCDVCGARCEGRFDGCPEVWANGPVQVELVRRPAPRYGARSDTVGARSSNDAELADVRASLERLETRLTMLEMNVTRLVDAFVARDHSSNGATTKSPAGGDEHARGNNGG